jgi:glycosyltransferase involved in cell wall biosynthesis
MTLLTASMIVRDEAAHLAACLESIRPVVDEIVVVDTGSVDNSREIARAFGARVFDWAWRDDFAAARNEALGHSRGDWILYIDADERLRPVARATVERLLADPGTVGLTLRLHPRVGYTAYAEYRLFRNDPRIRFRGAIHEKIPPALEEVAAADGLSIGACDLALDHVGYEGDQRHKHRRNLPLLRRQIEAEPDRVFLWSHLGSVLAGLGDDAGAEQAWLGGIAVVRRRGVRRAEDCQPFVDLVRARFERGLPVADLLDEASDRFPGNHLLRWVRARILMRGGAADIEAALALFEALAAIDGERYFDPQIAYDARIFGVFAYESIGLCHFRLGRFAAAERAYARAAECEPDNPAHGARRRLAAARAGRG